MTEDATYTLPLPPPGKLKKNLYWLAIVFVSGGIVGGVWGSVLTRHRILTMLHHPDQIPDRIMPTIRSKLALSNEQASRVEDIVRQRYANMELLRAEVYPSQREEFTKMHDDVALLLNEQQQVTWTALCRSVEQRYIPAEPAGPPIDLIFFRFDANDDDILTKDEIPPRMWLRLGMADENGDGNVTRDEFVSASNGNVD